MLPTGTHRNTVISCGDVGAQVLSNPAPRHMDGLTTGFPANPYKWAPMGKRLVQFTSMQSVRPQRGNTNDRASGQDWAD